MFDKGTRVFHSKLKRGTVLGYKGEYVEVLWDQRPPLDFNMGVNPCMMVEGSIMEAEDDEDIITIDDDDNDPEYLEDDELDRILRNFTDKYRREEDSEKENLKK